MTLTLAAKKAMTDIMAQVVMEWAVQDLTDECFGQSNTKFMQLSACMFAREQQGVLMTGGKELAAPIILDTWGLAVMSAIDFTPSC